VELVVVGSHGHSGVSDLIHGTVINDLRHHIQAAVTIIPMSLAPIKE
jgi:manganese transport protein